MGGIIILILKGYILAVAGLCALYAIRHLIFAYDRLLGKQRIFYGDIIDDELPSISVLVPMHNEEKVAPNILKLLVEADYPKDRYEIIPINDHSEDKTKEIVDEFAQKYSFIHPLHRYTGKRGKPAGLNDALKIAKGEIVLIFDADYLPPKGIIKELAVNFKDPIVGAVMGRVIPINADKNLLTKLLDLERCGGYQVDQQARYNLNLIPQYGGTVGGFRKDIVLETGGFDENVLAEDTELTYRMYTSGYKVVYANRAECWEEAPEDWDVRARQVKRWSRGHNQVMFKYFFKVLKSKYLTFFQKFDGILLLMVYLIPALLLLGWLDLFILFFLGDINIIAPVFVMLVLLLFSGFGNFAPFYEIATGTMIDGLTKRVRLLPFLMFNFVFNGIYISLGFLQAFLDFIKRDREVHWDKTERFREEEVTS
ncbi:glycosyltransferase family 2 protein [Persephonella sp.]|uniref:glycosyltransferase n=1 Tax=Persephonella sp. TaxID=2060922 RepID=UPI0026071244|nr:glycosyltransferase family 2 protein [Persephonella sp.]